MIAAMLMIGAVSGGGGAQPPAPAADAIDQQPTPVHTLYRLSGDGSLLPFALSDDGTRTYMQWDKDQALPAVFAINAQGEEESVDGYMRSDILTIDRIYQRLLFRIGKRKATARRAAR